MMKLSDITTQENDLKKIVEYILNLAANHSVFSEVVIEKNCGVDVLIRKNSVNSIEFNKNNILTITVYKNNRKGMVSSTDLSFKSIHNVFSSVMGIVFYSSPDEFSGLPDRKLLAINKVKDLDLYHDWDWNINHAIEIAKLSEREAFKEDKRIINSEGSCFNSLVRTRAFGNSLGMIECYSTTLYSTSCCVIAGDNGDMQRDFSFSVSRDMNDLNLPEKVGQDSAKKALSRLNSKKLLTMKTSAIFSSEIAFEFFINFAKAINGNNVYQKSTFLLHSLNTQVFPNWLTIEERPHIKKGLSSKCFDAEGVMTKTKKIVNKGILKTWLLDTYSARKINLVSTGNSGGIHNWLILGNSNEGLQSLLKSMNTGLLITELLGQGVSITTGNYSRGAVGFWVDQGVIKYPVNEITISGNLKNMFKDIVSIGNDIDKRHSIQSGSILLSQIQVSGI
ncbi:PmbA protein [Buchnera aphidicola str. Bp (Baizongia pistaciae)]|uniref:Metalloprotease PmbA homolog n=1 Tax=Buchnera aphidicola subsp. Baizongia pistaciae (strain Bp) TaxID=224915 RepID=PMBA_BUCBP|nr:metalloprotease PmbA [Buchnera aphidicola]Q89AY6.1 RecName: Full=Metalloprotease PmbA homolog [Buchnera aphidicola str. Bp (Baizongia pistaciae)]AAO26819.1 PmbA protein [Buchnera aphidicola str. Bp (Baizongia pistaciae)]